MNQNNYITDIQIQKLKQVIRQQILPFYASLPPAQTLSDIEHEHFLQQAWPDFIGFMRRKTFSGIPAWVVLAENGCWQTMSLIQPFMHDRSETAAYFLCLENSCAMCPDWLTAKEMTETIQSHYFHVSASNMNHFIEHYPGLIEPVIHHIAQNLAQSLKTYRPDEDFNGESRYQISAFNALFNAGYAINQDNLPLKQASHALVSTLFIFQEIKHNELQFFSGELLKNIYEHALCTKHFNGLFINMEDSTKNDNETLLLDILRTHAFPEHKEQIYNTCCNDLRMFGIVNGYFEKTDLMNFCKNTDLAKEMYTHILDGDLTLKEPDLKRRHKI